MKIGIISDTHGKLHPPVLELIASCDVVLHVGDVDNSQTLDQLWMHLKPNAPFYLVRGNNDRGWAERIAKTQRFCQAGVSFFMVHDRKDVSWAWTVYRWLSSGTVISLPWKKLTEDSG